MHVCVRVISLKHLPFIILPSSLLPSFLLSSPLPASDTICDVGEKPLKVGNRHEERLRNQEEEVRVDINPLPPAGLIITDVYHIIQGGANHISPIPSPHRHSYLHCTPTHQANSLLPCAAAITHFFPLALHSPLRFVSDSRRL